MNKDGYIVGTVSMSKVCITTCQPLFVDVAVSILIVIKFGEIQSKCFT